MSVTRLGQGFKDKLKTQKRELHGMSKSPTFSTWQNMRQRCYNPDYTFYEYYGGRGIRVCDRWLDSFANFYADMGEKPKGMSLDRIDSNGKYSPENCRWADSKTQNTNKRLSYRNISGVSGVTWNKRFNKWKVHITLGTYDDLDQAIKVRNKVFNYAATEPWKEQL